MRVEQEKAFKLYKPLLTAPKFRKTTIQKVQWQTEIFVTDFSFAKWHKYLLHAIGRQQQLY